MATLFADIKTPFVNDITLKKVMSARVKDNIFQGILTKPGEAVTEKFSEDTDAAEIQVVRVKPDDTDARELGASVNGGWFNANSASTPATEAYPIRIIETIDNQIDIPTNAQDMIAVDLAEAELTNLAGKVNRNINAATIAAYLVAYCNKYDATATGNAVELASSNPKYLDALVDAQAKLDDGNADQGIDTYPSESRAILIRASAKAALLKSGQLIVGGSNYAQDIIRQGGVDANTKPNTTVGYVGDIAGSPVYVVSNPVWTLAEKYAGVTAGAFAGVQMLVVSSIGTGRALAFNSAIKMIDSPAGQGRRIQPKYRFGVECWDAMSVVPVVSNGWDSPRATSAAGALVVRAPGSRS